MKSKIFEALFSMSAILAILCLPIIAGAEHMPWTSTTYSAYTQVAEFEGNQEMVYFGEDYHFEATPGASHHKYNNRSGGYGIAFSENSKFKMRVNATSFESKAGHEMWAYSGASFYGEYIGTADTLNFSYTLNTNAPLEFGVYDKTTDETIITTQFYSGSNTINVFVPIGHVLQVSLTLEARADSFNDVPPPCDTCVTPEGIIEDNASLHYSISLGNGESE